MGLPGGRRSVDLRKCAKPLIAAAALITLVMGALLGHMASWSLAGLMASPVLLILALAAFWIRPVSNLRASASHDVQPRTQLEGHALGSARQQAMPDEIGLSSISSSAPGNFQTSRAAHILVAEDDPMNQNVARLMLRKFGCRVDLVGDGEEAIVKAAGTPYDLILMDCTMPLLDGYRATRRIRAAEGERRRVPIIALTANALPENRDLCLAAGMDDILIKPVLVDQMRTMLLRWLPEHLVESA